MRTRWKSCRLGDATIPGSGVESSACSESNAASRQRDPVLDTAYTSAAHFQPVRIVSAGLQLSFKMSKQMAPFALETFGCHTFVSNRICVRDPHLTRPNDWADKYCIVLQRAPSVEQTDNQRGVVCLLRTFHLRTASSPATPGPEIFGLRNTTPRLAPVRVTCPSNAQGHRQRAQRAQEIPAHACPYRGAPAHRTSDPRRHAPGYGPRPGQTHLRDAAFVHMKIFLRVLRASARILPSSASSSWLSLE